MTNPEPRTVTLEQIEAEIASEHCFTAGQGAEAASDNAKARIAGEIPAALDLLTFCVLVLRNGFTVTGQSACADPAKFNAEKGRELAREDAIRQCWALLGFRLRDQMAAEAPAQPERKRYTHEDVDLHSFKWATLPIAEDPFQDKFSYVGRMRDGKEIRGTVQLPYDGRPLPPAHVTAFCARDAILVANREPA